MAELSTAPVITVLFASVAWFLSLFGGVYCKFLTNTLTTANSQGQPITLNYGIWYYQGYGIASTGDETVVFETCRAYPDEMYQDAKWKSAMATSLLAIIIGAFVTIWAWYASCSTPSKSMFRIAGLTLMICCLFEGVSLVFLNSAACDNNTLTAELQESLPSLQLEDTCTMSVGSKCTIAATVFWFLAALPALKVDIPPLGAVDTEKKPTADEKVVDPDSKLFDKDQAADEGEIGDEHTLETTEAA